MDKPLKIVLAVVSAWVALVFIGAVLNLNNSGLSQSQRENTVRQVNIESCIDEANQEDIGRPFDERAYCECVIDKAIDKVGVEAFGAYTDVEEVVKEFYPEIKACVNRQLNETEQI